MSRRRKPGRPSARSVRRKKAAITLNVPKSVLREIYGVFYLGLGVFTVLALNNSFGIIGEMWVAFLKPILGWGIYGFPFVLILISLMYFLSRRVHFPLSRILGVGLMGMAVLSILHLSVPMGNIYTMAKAGEYGGYIGFMMNFLMLEMLQMGSLGATAVFLVVFLTGVLLTFQLSLLTILKMFKPSLPTIKINQVDDAKVRRGQMEVDEDTETANILGRIDKMPDGDFAMPAMDLAGQESTLQIRRAAISGTAAKTEESVVDSDGVIQEKVSEEVGQTRQITIKNESEEALTSKSTAADLKWEPPSLDLLAPAVPDVATDDELLADNARKIKAKLNQFGIDVSMHEVHVGPTVIQYTLKPSEGIKLSKITSLKNDLALALAATAIRIEAPIPGKGLVGIEVPNEHRSVVHLREILESKEYREIRSNLRFPLGRDVAGKPVSGDLSSMPHLLIAGATGSGKSVGMNAFLLSLLYQNSPSDLRLILIDPKQVELKTYNGLPHLLTPVINDPEKAAIALRWCVAEMNRRYRLLSDHGVRNIHEYNEVVLEKQAEEAARQAEGDGVFQEAVERAHQVVEAEDAAGQPDESGEPSFLTMPETREMFEEIPQKMPNIVLIIDELADLMMSAGKEVEASVCRIAQMARAVGMHLVLATQRPSVDVITGLIKANIPARIAFAVSSQIDSRTIIDGVGAEDLLGKGDMLYLSGGTSKLIRIQGIYVSTKEIERVVNNVKLHGEPMYEDIVSPKIATERVHGLPKSDLGDEEVGDDMYEQALQVVMESRKASASLLQRRLKVGYARAARLLDMMEEKGAIGPVNGAKAREIYLD